MKQIGFLNNLNWFKLAAFMSLVSVNFLK